MSPCGIIRVIVPISAYELLFGGTASKVDNLGRVVLITPKVKPVSSRFGSYPPMPVHCPSLLTARVAVQPKAFQLRANLSQAQNIADLRREYDRLLNRSGPKQSAKRDRQSEGAGR